MKRITMNNNTRSIGELLTDVFFLFLSLCNLGLLVFMSIGMLKDNAAFMLPFPIVLAVPAFALIAYTGYKLFTGKSYPIPYFSLD